MSNHKLLAGRQIIDAISQMGEALGYSVRTELPVEQGPRSPAVDIAWFSADDQRFPLMIFEVESAATNAMANNPTKVFGQSSEQFERPLFFFHIIVQAGNETSRINSLKGVFGTHNYRVYRLDAGMATEFVKDVLSQHRRIRHNVCVGSLFFTLFESPALAVEKTAILEHAADLGLQGAYLSDLALLASERKEAQALYLHFLHKQSVLDQWCGIDLDYDTWFGKTWSYPVHLGLLSASGLCHPDTTLEQLRLWQEESSSLSQIGPHFGFSWDYDRIILEFSGTLFGLLAALFIRHQASLDYIAKQSVRVVQGLTATEPEVWQHIVSWTLHIVATAQNEELYETIREFANQRGGVSSRTLYSPPSHGSLEDPDWLGREKSKSKVVPSFQIFQQERVRRYPPLEESSAIKVALEALVMERLVTVIDCKSIIRVLAQRH